MSLVVVDDDMQSFMEDLMADDDQTAMMCAFQVSDTLGQIMWVLCILLSEGKRIR